MKREEGRIDEVWGGGKISQMIFGESGKGSGPSRSVGHNSHISITQALDVASIPMFP
jgi:hypothetical protein